MIATWVYERIPEERRPELFPSFHRLTQADGSTIDHLGSVWIPITLTDGITRRERVYIADIDEECLLGWRFLKKIKAKIDFAEDLLIVPNIASQQEDTDDLESPFPHRINKISVSHLADLYDRAASSVPEEYHAKIKDLLEDYSDVFSEGEFDIGRTSVLQHKITTKPGTKPIKQAPYRTPIEKQAEIDRQVEMLLEKDLIEISDAAWASPVLLVQKKDGSQRLCVDYRKVNSATEKDAFPIPRIDDTLDCLSGATFFSTLDLAVGYWQVPLDDDAKNKSTEEASTDGRSCLLACVMRLPHSPGSWNVFSMDSNTRLCSPTLMMSWSTQTP